MNTHEALMIKVTNGVAVAGLTSQQWLPTLEDVSVLAAQMVPILSALWLMVQITPRLVRFAHWIIRWRQTRKMPKEVEND